VPPDVTVGVEELALGADEVPVVPDEELPLFVVEAVPELDDEVDPFEVLVESGESAVRCVLLAPGCSRATTTPIAAVAAVAATMAPRVRLRSLDRAFSLDSGVFCSSADAMRTGLL
jgi:hypothetical protein